MEKTYTRINWENYPSTETPINETNLNKIDYAVNEIDNRVIELDTTKLNLTTANTMVKSIAFDSTTGVFTITNLNGSIAKIDTKIEKLAVNFAYDYTNQRFVITLDDGTIQYVDMSALVTQNEFVDSETIGFSTGDSGTVSAIVLEGSIEEKHLQPNYLADIKVESASATASAESAASSATAAKASETAAAKVKDEVDTALESATELNDTALATLEDVLASVKDYYERAEAMYNSLYLECDGETPALRAVTALSIDCGNPAQRALDDGGILFDGGTPTSRAVAS